MADRDKRLRYYNGQFLQEQDFTTEQEYHLDRQRRHNRQLHNPGIAEGLIVTAAVGASSAVVSPGTALDSEGRQIVLTENRTVPFGTITNQPVLVMISYREQTSDPATVGDEGDTRWLERPDVVVVAESAVPAADSRIRLARLYLNSIGVVSQHDTTVRTLASAKLGPEVSIEKIRLSRQGVAQTQWPVLSSETAGQADVKGNLSVTGNVLVTGTVDGRDVSVDGAKLDTHAARTDNPHSVTAAQVQAITGVGGVLNPGGQVNLLAGNNVAITSDNSANKRITISSATIKGLANPGGNIDLVGQAGSGITITPDSVNKLITFNTDLAQAATYLRRAVAKIYFNWDAVTGAMSTAVVGFRPKFIWVTGLTYANLNGGWQGGTIGSICRIDETGVYALGHGPSVQRFNYVPYISISNLGAGGGNQLFAVYYRDYTTSPPLDVSVDMRVAAITDSGFTVQFNKSTAGGCTLPSFGVDMYFAVFG